MPLGRRQRSPHQGAEGQHKGVACPGHPEGPISITVKYINKLIFILSVCFVI